ncbi:MAG TPA: hypothetical protein VLK22_00465 [Candidatus Udaeobacter sp.]|nr:hypothetical protein [Candidatus Udaeobacter sp.]
MKYYIIVAIAFIAFGCASTVQQPAMKNNTVPMVMGANAQVVQPVTGAAPRAGQEVMDMELEFPKTPKNLTIKEVQAELGSYTATTNGCYLKYVRDVRRATYMDLAIVVGWNGYPVSINVVAPGLSATTEKKIESCVRDEIGSLLHFPERRFDTTAVIRYEFQHTYTETPGGGPQLSCYNPNGCH